MKRERTTPATMAASSSFSSRRFSTSSVVSTVTSRRMCGKRAANLAARAGMPYTPKVTLAPTRSRPWESGF